MLEEKTPSGWGTNLATTRDLITETAGKMLDDGARARQKRFDDIKKNEDQYFGVVTPALKGRSNIPFDSVVMGGFIDTLVAGSRQEIKIAYGHTREQDIFAAKKVTAVWERESGPDKGDWQQTLMDTKLLAALSGVGINKLYIESTPKFHHDLLAVDHYDFVTEALGGADLDRHLYKFQMNIFRTRQDLLDGVGSGYYDKNQVRKLIAAYASPEKRKEIADTFTNKQMRYATFGIDIATMGFVGQELYRLTEGVLNYNGQWYYIVFSRETNTWIRLEPLGEVFDYANYYPGRGPWTAFHTHRHPFIFWSKAPADDVRPVGYTMKKIVNYAIDNLEKRNWDMTAYDPKIFTDPTQLLYRQDGLVRATLKPNQNIANGLYKFQTPDTTGITINLVEWLNGFLGQKTGITPDAQGAAQTERVGILISNIEQTSKRLQLTNDRFKQTVVDLGVMFDYGVYEHLREPYAVKIIGIKGAQWEEEVTRKDAECEFSCTVRAADEEEQKNALEIQKRELAFQRLDKHPELIAKVNQNEYLRTVFEDAGLDNEKINNLLDTNNDGDQESRAKAAQAIQDCLEGKPIYKLYRSATPGFVEKIITFCYDNYDLVPPDELAKMSKGERARYAKDMETFDKLVAYAQKHIPIVQENMERKAVSMIASMGAAPAPAPGAPIPGAPAPMPAAPAAPTLPI